MTSFHFMSFVFHSLRTCAFFVDELRDWKSHVTTSRHSALRFPPRLAGWRLSSPSVRSFITWFKASPQKTIATDTLLVRHLLRCGWNFVERIPWRLFSAGEKSSGAGDGSFTFGFADFRFPRCSAIPRLSELLQIHLNWLHDSPQCHCNCTPNSIRKSQFRFVFI